MTRCSTFTITTDEILADTKTSVARREDETIAGLGRDEARLDAELTEGIARQTLRCRQKNWRARPHAVCCGRLLFPARVYVKYWFAVALRNHHIKSPYAGISYQLDHVRYDKKQHVNNKQATIERECSTVVRSYNFLK